MSEKNTVLENNNPYNSDFTDILIMKGKELKEKVHLKLPDRQD